MEQYDIKGLIYSMDQKLNLKDLRSGNYNNSYNTQPLENWLNENNVNFQIGDFIHPKFKSILNPPYIIYYKGNIDIINKTLIGIVGPRKPSVYGFELLNDLFEELKNYQIVTVSGLADGVDTQVHELSIKHGIPTIAVLGGGISYYLGTYKKLLIENIVKNGGLVLSEFKLDLNPATYTFPQRNRIIAGLSDYLILPEAGEKSGSLITVDFAISMGKPVYSFPNGIYCATSAGTNRYIAENKINCIYDIGLVFRNLLTNYNIGKLDLADNSNDLSIDEQSIYNIIKHKKEIDINDIIRLSNIDPNQIYSLISMLEVKGLITQIFPGVYKTI